MTASKRQASKATTPTSLSSDDEAELSHSIPIRMPLDLLERIDRAVKDCNLRHPGSNASRSSILLAIISGKTSLGDLEKASGR